MQTIRTLHKYISLGVGALWFLQALTGTILVFHRELDDAMLGARPVSIDMSKIDARIAAVRRDRPGSTIGLLTVSGGLPGYFDLFATDKSKETDVLRLDGQGDVLRTRPYEHDYASMTGFRLLYIFHTSLFAGATGRIFLGLSGVLLLTTIIFGLQLAWPPRGRWRRWLWPTAQAQSAMTWFTWHRAVGLWFAAPAIVFVSAGAILGLIEPIDDLLGVSTKAPAIPRTVERTAISPSKAIEIALAQYPGSRFAVLEMPAPRAPWYRIRVRAPGEPRRVFGTTAVYVSAADGAVLADYDARTAPLATQFAMDTFPVHTGEIAGLGGRVLSMANGIWLMTMAGLGLTLWWTRRTQRRPRARRSRAPINPV